MLRSSKQIADWRCSPASRRPAGLLFTVGSAGPLSVFPGRHDVGVERLSFLKIEGNGALAQQTKGIHPGPLSWTLPVVGQKLMQGSLLGRAKAVAYVALNIVSGTSIVFLNKVVFSVYGFSYIYALAFIHAAVTAVGMWGFGWCGVFEPKRLPLQSIIPLAGSFLGYIVCWNLSLRVNPVGFYQLSKILITPTVVALEVVLSSKWPSKAEQAAIATLCAGVSLATVTDPNLQANVGGLVIGAAAVLFAAVYQVCSTPAGCQDRSP